MLEPRKLQEALVRELWEAKCYVRLLNHSSQHNQQDAPNSHKANLERQDLATMKPVVTTDDMTRIWYPI
jgi:hypothetical protein